MPTGKTCKGAIHIHSDYSDGSGRVEDIISAAQAAGLDYLIITDHGKLRPEQHAFQGRHDNLLVVYGVEFSVCRFTKRHYLALGVDSHEPYKGLSFHERLRRIDGDGGISIIAHPAGVFKPWLAQMHRRWKAFPEEPFHGLEIWTYMHDWTGNLRLTRMREQYRDPDHNLRGPDAKLLGMWDALNRKRRIAGVGSLDNHARYVPFFGVRVFPYEYLFRRLLTHVETEGFTGDAKEDIPRLLKAIAAGRSYFANNAIAPPDGFRFFAECDDGGHGVGSWLEGAAGALRVISPHRGEMKLVCNGAPVMTEHTDEMKLRNPPPGAYRVEVRLDGAPWLFTNHINISAHASTVT